MVLYVTKRTNGHGTDIHQQAKHIAAVRSTLKNNHKAFLHKDFVCYHETLWQYSLL